MDKLNWPGVAGLALMAASALTTIAVALTVVRLMTGGAA